MTITKDDINKLFKEYPTWKDLIGDDYTMSFSKKLAILSLYELRDSLQWILIGDRLPELNEEGFSGSIEFVNKNKETIIGEYMNYDGDSNWCDRFEEYWFKTEEIICWRNIPMPYDGGIK